MFASALGNIGGPEALLRHRSLSVRSSGPLLRAVAAARPASRALDASVNSGMRPSGGSDTSDERYRPFTMAKCPHSYQTPSSNTDRSQAVENRRAEFPFQRRRPPPWSETASLRIWLDAQAE